MHRHSPGSSWAAGPHAAIGATGIRLVPFVLLMTLFLASAPPFTDADASRYLQRGPLGAPMA